MTPQHSGTGNRHGSEALNDATLFIHKQAVSHVGHSAGYRHKQYAWQQVVYIVICPCLNCAAKHIDEQQQHCNWSETNREDGVHTAEDMAHRTAKHHAHIADKMIFCRLH
ncbi:hypothetical protein D3C73_1237030 [compost metagenome]